MFDDHKPPSNLPVGDDSEPRGIQSEDTDDLLGDVGDGVVPASQGAQGGGDVVGDGDGDSSAALSDIASTPPAAPAVSQKSDPQSGGVRMRGGELVDAPSALDAGKIKPKRATDTPTKSAPLVVEQSVSPSVAQPAQDPGVVSAAAQAPNALVDDHAPLQESFVMRHKFLVGLSILLVVVVLVLVGFTFVMHDSDRVADNIDNSIVDEVSQEQLFPDTIDDGGIEVDVEEDPVSELESESDLEQNVQEDEVGDTKEDVLGEDKVGVDEVVSDDPDGDGLTTTKELLAGTDPYKSDSDNDGLTDKEELNIWNTDPLDADTDDDTYEDGHEVRHGFNPNGPGRLFDVPE